MNVSALFIYRPVATFLLAIAVLLGGFLGYSYLAVSALPQVDFPTIQVTTQLPGANPDTMAELVTAPLERQLGQIPSLQTMTSSSAFGLSSVTLQFELNRDIDGAAQDVQAAINAAASTLPKNLPYPPVYSKVNPADTAVIEVALTSPTTTIREMSDVADTLIGQRLSELSGVGHVGILGGLKPAVRIQVDLSRLSDYGVGMEDVRTAISNANVAGAKGSLDGKQQSYTIGANDQLDTAQAYKNVVITYRNAAPVLISDVADVVDGLENAHVAGWYQGKPAVIIDVQRQPGANVVATVQRIRAELDKLKTSLPAGVAMTIVSDRTGTIKASIADVQFTLVLSVVLVVLVVLVFLRSIRATIIAGVALPLSLDRHLRRHVLPRLQPRQPVAHGADDRHRLRRRRRHRHDREHRAPSRAGRDAAGGGAERRARDRLHRHLADRVADRGVHPAALHDGHRRSHVPRVRAGADDRRRRLGRRLADADADDVRPAVAAQAGGPVEAAGPAEPPRRRARRALPPQPRMGAAPPGADAARHRRDAGRDDRPLRRSSRRASCRRRIPASSPPSPMPTPPSPSTRCRGCSSRWPRCCAPTRRWQA